MATIYPKRISFIGSDGNTYYRDFPNNGETAVTTSTIGEPGQAGFGVGVYPGTQEELSALGLTAADNNDNPTSDNYGLYLHTDGNVRFIPKFYYKVGYTEADADDPFYSKSEFRRTQGAKYGNNALAIVGTETFKTEAEANAAGYVLHRAFIDGGEEKDGFFIDEFIASRGTDGTSTTAKSVANGLIASLDNSGETTQTDGMLPACDGTFYDALTLSRARGSGWNCASIFMYSALSMLSLCHGEFSESDAHCAWYDPEGITNYPKGCNNNLLGDSEDGSIVYVSSISPLVEDSNRYRKPKTGSCNYPAKVAHNGQNCGIKDLNGCITEIAPGLCINQDDLSLYAYKSELKFSDFTGNSADSEVYESVHDTSDGEYIELYMSNSDSTSNWGNEDAGVFSNKPSGGLRDICGCCVPEAGSWSINGTNLFGQDLIRFPVLSKFGTPQLSNLIGVGGSYSLSYGAGVFCRLTLPDINKITSETPEGANPWAFSDSTVGFRCAAYAS